MHRKVKTIDFLNNFSFFELIFSMLKQLKVLDMSD